MFTFIARSLNISMWFPLILLIIPTILSFWTSKRRKRMYGEIREFERQVKKALSEFTKHDCSYFIVWSFEKMQLDKAPCKHLQLCFMIRVIQLDPEMGLQYSSSSNSNSCQSNEELPTYNTAILYPSSTFQPPPDYADIAQLDPAHVH
ncbi:uncharacterized protein RHIMIDRAFT_246185 [Rhizopus microsporus ATCC 52813]|uniref:Uncharacterized protein n=1 Tax=Rhizopus microsporus ATCC 52813 TaxID=1340429 RepID=A0A2G4SKE2_RHIZD|nr:uncharacterized protein RHIMIDRAFT_246185 [Rhizopus microsporus ATCC 52813]PHZ09212.1 hypothetical protein RHIMIDRAFT_246185 [Rhizopus microsporus ATCC 52813]